MQKEVPERESFVLALAENQDVLYAYIYLRLGGDGAAKDVLQETNLSIWKKMGTLDSIGHFLPWAKNLAFLEIRHYLTNRKRDDAKIVFDSETVDTLSELLAAPGAEEEHYDEIDYWMLKECMGKLPSAKRAMVMHRYWDGATVESIAREKKVPYSTIAMQLNRIRKALGDCIRHLRCKREEPFLSSPENLARAERIERVFDGDGIGLGEACELLRRDPDCCREWLEAASIHAALLRNRNKLHAVFAPEQTAHAFIRFRLRSIAAAAALFALLGGGIAFWSLTAARQTVPSALDTGSRRAMALDSAKWQAMAAESLRRPSAETVQSETPAEPAPSPVSQFAAAAQAQQRIEEENKTMQAVSIKAGTLATVTAAGLVLATSAASAFAAATRIVITGEDPVYWETAYTNQVPICWEACPKAVSAELTATSLNGGQTRETYSADDGNAAWTIPSGKEEDLYTLSLRYLDANGGALLAVTSCVARVKGVNGASAPVDFGAEVATNTAITSWAKLRRPGAATDNRVLAYNAAWATTGTVSAVLFTATPKNDNAQSRSATISGAAGYFGWKVAGQNLPFGWYTVSLNFGGTTLSQDVFRSQSGMVVMLL